MAFDDLTFGDHLASWSRIDFLFSLGDAKFAHFMSIMKTKIPVAAGKIPDTKQVLAQQLEALEEAYGFDPAAFDTAWKGFVLATYPNK